MAIVAKVGDVFLIPLDETSVAIGHLIAIRENEELYLAIFNQKVRRDEVALKVAVSGEPILLTLAFDAKLFHGDWPIIGNVIDVERYPEPAFKVKYAGVMCIESRDKRTRRPATADELEILEYRSVASPAVIEDAIKAHFGIGQWNVNYEKRRAKYVMVSSTLI